MPRNISRENRRVKIWSRLIIFGVLLLIVGGCNAVFTFSTKPRIEYSNGTRTGNLRKLSKKGFIFKTWEGELMLNAGIGTVKLDTFLFSVPNDSLAQELEKHVGENVDLIYQEYIFTPYRVGDTDYHIKDFSVAGSEPDTTNTN